MQKSRSGISIGMTNTRPKPPCWLDLKVQTSSDEGGSKNSPVGPQPSSYVRSSRPTKRTRARIHRTRSEYCIQTEDLPDCDMTLSLADTDPQDIGLRSQDGIDETTKKCQTWLESIEVCGPPEGTDTSALDIDTVELEVPDDTLWYDDPRRHPSPKPHPSRSRRDKHKHSPSSDSRLSIPGHLFDFGGRQLLAEQQMK
ncbi:Hypothetical predicted protein [Mytilus galloprovincialis]|uniref:Uncharacterized protein n=1 Tax=Mytilus galloprovincialis TaxID=29158 RepID=A0A8B6D9S1_MYTGA|nr:Hypothetical predicted protein [Mytilus galloprovincialis]